MFQHCKREFLCSEQQNTPHSLIQLLRTDEIQNEDFALCIHTSLIINPQVRTMALYASDHADVFIHSKYTNYFIQLTD
jgi:hypothetical protein